MNASKTARYLSDRPTARRCLGLRSHDLASLVCGVKRVVYTNTLDAGDAAALREMCAELGLFTAPLDNPGSLRRGARGVSNVLIATDTEALNSTKACYDRGASPEECGLALGYPECCCRAYRRWTRVKDSIDVVDFVLNATPPGSTIPFTMNNVWNWHSRLRPDRDFADAKAFHALNPDMDPDPVLPWHPCSYACRASLEAGRRIYGTLERFMPGAAGRRRRALGRPVLFKGMFAFAVLDGKCSAQRDGFAVVSAGLASPRTLLPGPEARGLDRELRLRFDASFRPAAGSPAGFRLLPFTARLTAAR